MEADYFLFQEKKENTTESKIQRTNIKYINDENKLKLYTFFV